MLFKPIPLHLLIHTVTYMPPEDEGDGGMDGGNPSESQEIKQVRFAPSRKKVMSTDNVEILTSGILFIDAVSSKSFLIPTVGGEIIFNGSRLSIVEVTTAFTTTDKPHHVEVMLQ